jgi:hypothetical protein
MKEGKQKMCLWVSLSTVDALMEICASEKILFVAGDIYCTL